ncbi:CYTH domain-containing protein [Lutimonas zeaxanthinifaciens]|uniref:CYTH domain-containing protein n=1 Tax=Lutimonas zeaxanthinifaciens TaxID=3060215 RepID=UPI00265D553F|nr:CYTH domain-containing protein [Lutimonas sp. YSD2104]WKK65157.1 CYTH domain-containing protein [Lutimonas sp. YSD2104]
MGNKEVERKFLVLNDEFKKESFKNERIVQGFLSSVPERTVRVRIIGEKGFITIKGIGNGSGTTRFEWEKEIEVSEAESLLAICEPGSIEKTRYFVRSGVHIIEVDEFGSENQGLTIAEIELSDEDETYLKPKWLGTEVTGQAKYYNSSLVKKPFNQW